MALMETNHKRGETVVKDRQFDHLNPPMTRTLEKQIRARQNMQLIAQQEIEKLNSQTLESLKKQKVTERNKLKLEK